MAIPMAFLWHFLWQFLVSGNSYGCQRPLRPVKKWTLHVSDRFALRQFGLALLFCYSGFRVDGTNPYMSFR